MEGLLEACRGIMGMMERIVFQSVLEPPGDQSETDTIFIAQRAIRILWTAVLIVESPNNCSLTESLRELNTQTRSNL